VIPGAITAFIDGSCFGNPGEAGYGFVIQDEDGRIIEKHGRYIGRATNNVAEYRALLGCLEWAREHHVRSLTVFSDSLLLVQQVMGRYRVKEPRLKTLHNEVMESLKTLGGSFRISHLDREDNKEADRMARSSIRQRSDVRELS
jgi:ribonuclease HI